MRWRIMHFSLSKFAARFIGSRIVERDVARSRSISRRMSAAFPVVLLLLLPFAASPAGAQRRNLGPAHPRIGQPGSFAPGQIIVGLKPGVPEDRMRQALADAKATLLR